MKKLNRREFVALGAVGGVSLVIGGIAWLRNTAQPQGNLHQSVPSPTIASKPNPFSLTASSLPLEMWVTANQDFYTVQYAQTPEIGMGSWSLTVTGLVRESLQLTYDQVKALPAITQMHTLECIGNPVGGNLIGNAEWRGISLRDLLQHAGVDSRARYVVIDGVDEYLTSVPIERAMHEHAILAYEMNGEPLPLKHGFPLRAILPGVYGQKQPKWVTGILVREKEELGPWEQQGWSREATIQLNSAIRIPDERNPVPPGDILIAGVAHAGVAGIESVQVSTDGGTTWDDATLTRGTTPYVWTVWGFVFKNAPVGRHRLMVRTIGKDGAQQESQDPGLFASVFPNGTSVIHSILVDVARP